jgi:dipeptidyl-peptidase-4
MAGQKSQKVELGIFDPAINQITYIQTPGPSNQYLTSVSWGPAGEYIYIGLLNRDQNHLEMNKYDAATGKFIVTLFEEKKQTYVEPQHSLSFLANQPERFIWQSRRDGWSHLYLYNTKGELLKQLTQGDWEVTEFLGFDNGENNIFYESTQASPIQRQVYSTDLKTGKTKRITQNEGSHSLIASKSKNYFLDIFSSLEMARAYYLLDKNGETLATLKIEINPWEGYKIGETEIFTLTADDGKTDLYCRLIKPIDFDAGKKYPVLVYVYGGPHAQLITNSWTGGAGFWLNLMAQRDYVVFTLDNRGSANRGQQFEDIIHRQCGEMEMADQMTGIEYLKSLDYVDPTRIGVDGWSYGGFLTTSLFLRQPGVFKAACAGGPVIDWKWYEVMYGERYMDTPLQNPEGYKKANVLNYIENLEGRLLIIHGTNDPVVMWQNSLIFLDACIQQGKQVDYFVYPGAGHNMRGKARVHMFEKITTFFDEHLK